MPRGYVFLSVLRPLVVAFVKAAPRRRVIQTRFGALTRRLSMTHADPHCTTCHGNGTDPATGNPGCPDCGGDTPAATGHHGPPPAPPGAWKAKAKKALKVIAILGAIIGVLALAVWGIPKAYNALTYKGSGDSNASAPAPTSTVNLDPTKPPASATATAIATSKKCPPGTLLDTERDVCVERNPVTIPSAITINVPCPGSCGSAAPTTSASAPPPLASAAPTATATTTPTAPKPPAPAAIIPVRIDLTKVLDPAKFPSGN